MDIQQFVGDPSERFRAAVDAALDGENEARLRALLDRSTVSESSAWLEHGLTWSDGSIGDDEAHWRSRLAALSDLSLRPEAELARVTPTLRSSTDTGSTANSAWLDNATIGAALDLLVGDGGYLSPGTLLDLETFIRTSVLHDHVFHLPNVAVDTETLNERLGERVYLGLPVLLDGDDLGRSSPLSAALYSLFWQSSYWLRRRRPDQVHADELWQAMTDGWGSLLGREPDPGQIAIEFDAGWDSPVQDLVRSLALVTTPDVGAPRADRDLDGWTYRWLAQSTARCLFNTELSRCLALPYAPGAARLPFQRHLLSRQACATRRLALTDAMDDALRKHLERLSVVGVVQPLPTFVAALLRTAADGGDLVAALADLRSRCSALRRRRAELQRALDDPVTRVDTVERISRALQADARKLSEKTEIVGVTASVGTLYVSLAFASAVPMAILATVGLVRLGLDVLPVGERLHGRLTRPYEKVLVDLGRTTRNLGDAVPQLRRRWGRPGFGDWDDFAAGLERVGHLGRG